MDELEELLHHLGFKKDQAIGVSRIKDGWCFKLGMIYREVMDRDYPDRFCSGYDAIRISRNIRELLDSTKPLKKHKAAGKK